MIEVSVVPDAADVLGAPQHVLTLLAVVAEQHGFKNPRFALSAGAKEGENFMGLIYRALVMEKGLENVEDLSFIVKTVPQSKVRRQVSLSSVLFRNEARIYDTVLPFYARLLREKRQIEEDSPYPDVPECFLVSVGVGAENEDTLILQDMRSHGFSTTSTAKGLSAGQCHVVVGALARLHACSMALEQTDPGQAKALRDTAEEVCFYENSPFSDLCNASKDRAYEMIVTRFPKGSSGYCKAKNFVGHLFEEMWSAVKPDPAGGNAFIHGDCWTSNLLFKYAKDSDQEETEQVTSAVRLLDFQSCRYSSPVVDLVNLLYVCTEREMRSNHLEEILLAYHRTLHANLRALGCDQPDKIFSWKRFQEHWKNRAKYGFGMALLFTGAMLSEAVEMPNLEGEGGSDLKSMFVFDTKNTEARDTRVCDVLEELIKEGCF